MRKVSRLLPRHWNLCNFGLLLPKFGCHGNSLGSLEILDSIFEIADPENLSILAKFVSISCTEMKLYLFQCLAYLYHCGYRRFSWFLRKIVEIVKKNNQTKRHLNSRKHVLWAINDVSTTNYAGEQERQIVKKVKIDTGGDNFTYTGTRPR